MRTPSSVPMLQLTTRDGGARPTVCLSRAEGPAKDAEPVEDDLPASTHQGASNPSCDEDL